MAIKRLTDPATAQAKIDDQVILDAVLSEIQRGNPGWRASIDQTTREAIERREARRGAP